MAELKTKPTHHSVTGFLGRIEDEQRRKDCQTILKLMKETTGAKPRMWGASIVGFGDYHYKYASGREGDWFMIGFSPRKHDLTLYSMAGLGRYEALLKQLGKFKRGKGCLYIKRLEDVDLNVLREFFQQSVEHLTPKA